MKELPSLIWSKQENIVNFLPIKTLACRHLPQIHIGVYIVKFCSVQCTASDYPTIWSAIFSNFGLDGWYRLYSICEKNRTLRFALCITMCFCSQQYKLTDSLFSCANICYAHFEDALKRGFKKAFLYEINANLRDHLQGSYNLDSDLKSEYARRNHRDLK